MADDDKTRPNISADMFRMLATARNDITIPNYTNVLRSQDETLLEKGGAKGIRLYDEVRRDGHALAVLGKRAGKVTARAWEVTPADDDDPAAQAAAELVERAIKRIAFDTMCSGLLEAVLYGYAVAEIEWELVEGKWILPRRVAKRQQARFVFDIWNNPRLVTMAEPSDGEPLPERKFIVHRHDEDGSDPYGRGLGRVLFWHVLFKREGIGFWANFLEKYASPTPVGRYPVGTPPSEQDQLLDNLVRMVQQGALAVPLGTEISFLETANTGNVSYGEWSSFWDGQTSVAVLGETLSTTLDGVGAKAATQTHMEVSDGVADGDADLLSATLQQTLAQWIIDYNMPGAPVPAIWRPRTKNESLIENVKTQRSGRIQQDLNNIATLQAMGYEPAEGIEATLSEIFDREIRLAPGGPKPFPAGMGGGQPQPMSGGFGGSAGGFGQASFADSDRGVSAIVDQVEDATQPVIEGWLDRVRSALRDAVLRGDSLTGFRDRLLTLYPDLAVTPLARILGDAHAVAELTGRSDVEDDIERVG